MKFKQFESRMTNNVQIIQQNEIQSPITVLINYINIEQEAKAMR